MIDILLAAYNGERYIEQQIDSILNQTYKEWRLIIKDDKSIDSTLNIIREYEKKFPGKIFVIESATNSGCARNNFMSMLELTYNEYVMFSDQDDLWLPDKIRVTMETMEKAQQKYGTKTPLLVHGDLIVVDKNLNIIADSMFHIQNLDGNKTLFNDLLVQNNITGCTMMINRCLLNKLSEVPVNYIMHDWWFGLIASAFGNIVFMDDKMIKYRQHGNNVEGAKDIRSISYMLKKAVSGREIKETLNKTYLQAVEFKKIYYKELDDANKEIIDAYVSLSSCGKIKRLKLINKYKFTKSGLFRKIGYYFNI